MNRPLLWIVLIFIVGIVSASLVSFKIIISILVLLILLATAVIIRLKGKHFVLILAFLLAFSVGIARLYFENNKANTFLQNYQDKSLQYLGVIDQPKPTQRGGLRFLLYVNEIKSGVTSTKYNTTLDVQCDDSRGLSLKQGDKVEITGNVIKPKSEAYRGGFDYQGYLKLRGIYACVYISQKDIIVQGSSTNLLTIFENIRAWIIQTIQKYIPGQEGELIKGILIGERDEFSDALNDDLVRSGTVHVVAVSGMQVSVLIMFIVMLSRLFGIMRRTTGIIGIIAVVCFTFVAGFQSSVLRAAITSIIFLLGMVLFRKADSMTSLAFSAGILAMYNPFNLYDVGFQLTFIATFGILILYEPIKNYLTFLPPFIKEATAVSISAQVFTAPIVAFNFSNVSIISLIANIIVVPYVDLIFLVTLLFLMVAPLWDVLGFGVGYLLKSMSTLVLYSVKGFSNMPYANLNVALQPWWIWVYYSALVTFMLLIYKIKNRLAYVLSLVCVLAFTTVGIYEKINSPVMQIEFISVRKFTFAHATASKTVGAIVLAGWDYKGNVPSKVMLDYLRTNAINELDTLVLTDVNSTQVECVKALQQKIRFKRLVLPDVRFGSAILSDLYFSIGNKPIEITYLNSDNIQIDGGITLNSNGLKELKIASQTDRFLEYNGKKFKFISENSSGVKLKMFKDGRVEEVIYNGKIEN